MATTIPSFSTVRSTIVSSAVPSNPTTTCRSNNWWSPLFGWSSEPDYISSSDPEPVAPARPDKKLFKVCFTEEKAKELLKKTVETSNFHNVMYHSAIASRLASDGCLRHRHRHDE